MGYDAFISYSHDTDGDRAKAIEDGLERFAKPWHRRRSLNVFRDSSGLSANPGLWTSISDVMEQSDWLVILCSPESAASPWVGREIEHWTATKPPGRILPVLTAGELAWDQASGTFDVARSTAAHPALAAGFTEEPLWVDMRFAASDDARTLRDPRFQQAIADLAAPMHGVAKDELIGEDIRQHRRTLRFAWAAVVALLVLAVGTLAGALTAYNKANEAQQYADQVVAANQSLDELRVEQATAQQELDDTNAELKSANAKVEQAIAEAEDASAEADEANAEAATSSGERDRANVDRDSARAESVQFRGIADDAASDAVAARAAEALARDGEDQANLSAADAEQRAREAADRQEEAELAAGAAEREKQRAIRDKGIADRAAEAAAVEAARQGDIARATQLAAQSSSADLRGRNMDLSLLLANEAASIEIPEAGGATAPVDRLMRSRASITADAHGALLNAVTDAATIEGYLHFGCRAPLAPPCPESPQKLGTVAASPDGTIVAAAEDSYDIQYGKELARVFVWDNANTPNQSQVVELPMKLWCLSEMQWLQGRVLLTVEKPFGCLKPQELGREQKVPYYASIVRLWDLDTMTQINVCDLVAPAIEAAGLEPSGLAASPTSPLNVAAGATYGAVSCEFGAGLALSVFLNGPALEPGTENGIAVVLNDVLGVTFSPSGRFAHVWDLEFGNGIIDLWEGDGFYWSGLNLFRGVSFGAVNAEGYEDAAVVTFVDERRPSSGISKEVMTFDPNTGRTLGQHEVRRGINGVSFADDELVVVDTQSRLFVYPANGAGDERVALRLPASLAAQCDDPLTFPEPSPRTTFVLVTRACDNFGGSVLVLDTNAGRVVRELRGELAYVSATGRYVVTEQFAVTELGESELPLFGYELWDFEATPSGFLVGTDSDARPALSPDGTVLVGVPSPLVPTNKPLSAWRLTPDGARGPLELPGSVGSAAVALTGGDIIGAGTNGGPVRWDPAKAPYKNLFEDPVPDHCAADGTDETDGNDNLLRSAVSADLASRAVSQDAQSIAIVSAGEDGTFQGSGRLLADLELVGDERIAYFFFTADAKWLLVNVEVPNPAPEENDHRCRNGDVVRSVLLAVDNSLAPVRFDDQAAIATSSQSDGLLFRSVDQTRLLVRRTSNPDASVELSTVGLPVTSDLIDNSYDLDPSGTHVAGTNSSGRTVLWTVADGGMRLVDEPDVQPTATVPLPGIRFSPDGMNLAVKSVDQVLRIYRLDDDNDPPQTRQLPTDAASRLFYSPDGLVIGVDGLYLFDATTLQPIGQRLRPATWNDPGRDRGSQASRFIEDTDGGLWVLVERAYDTGAVLWRVDAPELRERACSLAGRNLTEAEHDLYLPRQPPQQRCSF